MTRDHDLVVRESQGGVLDRCHDAVAGFSPRRIEAAVSEAAVADVCQDEGEVRIRKVVSDAAGAAKGDHHKLICVVDGDIAGYICDERAIANVSPPFSM